MHRDSQKPESPGRRRLVVALLAALAAFICHDGDIDGPLDLYHEGERLAQIDRIDAGAMPYLDVHVPHGLGEDVLKPLLARRLFGDSVAALRTLGQNSYFYRGFLPPLAAAAIVLAAGMLTRSIAGAAIACAVVCLSLYEVSERQAPGLIGIACLAGYLHSRRARWLFAAGLTAAAGLVYSFEVGLYLLAIAALWIPIDAILRRNAKPTCGRAWTRSTATFAAGLLAGLSPLVIWALVRGVAGGVVSTLYHQLFLRTQLYPSSYPTPNWVADQPLSANLLVNGGVLLLFYAIPIAYSAALMTVWRWKIDATRRSALALAALTGLVFWGTVIGRPDLWHLAYAMAGFIPFVATAFVCLRDARSNRALRAASAGLLLLIVTAAIQFGQFGAIGRNVFQVSSSLLPAHLRTHRAQLRSSTIPRLRGLRIPMQQADFLESLVGYIQRHTEPNDYILDLSDQGLLYYLAERKCPTRYAFVNYVGTPQLRKEMVDEMTRSGRLPVYVIRFATDQSTPDALGEFVDRYFKKEAQIGSVVLMRRLPSN
ncbi:MAG: hypothetical protein IPK83_07025 [Planctomycetes bacterium]|nr:hypothetical protein [Planctomycetota bacterium]